MQSHSTKRPRKRTRAYSIAEAEKIARVLPLQRRFSAIEAAYAVAQFLYPDPRFLGGSGPDSLA